MSRAEASPERRLVGPYTAEVPIDGEFESNSPKTQNRPLPWMALIMLALVGTALGTGLALLDLSRTQATNGGLIHTGPAGPAAGLMARELTQEPQFPKGQHDGPMYYAIARNPTDFAAAAQSLDRPRYRLQHPLLSWLAWATHPNGGGMALVWSFFAVTVAAIFVGSLSMGALSCTLRGPPYLALLFGILPGAVMSLRISVADALAVSLLLLALLLSLRNHTIWSTLVACAAVLAKEPMILGLIGFALWRRDRVGIAFAVAPIIVMGTWFLYLSHTVTAGGDQIIEFGVPFAGVASAARTWVTGNDAYAMLSVVPALAIGTYALARRGTGHPLALALGFQLAFMILLTRDVIGFERNGTRMSLPVLALGIVVLATPRGASFRRPAAAAPRSAGRASAD